MIAMADSTGVNTVNQPVQNPAETTQKSINQSLQKAATESRPQSQIQQSFTLFSQSLDRRNDRRERIYKAARDLTKASKKVIFILQRPINQSTNQSTSGVPSGVPSGLVAIPDHLLSQVREAQVEVSKSLCQILYEIHNISAHDLMHQTEPQSINQSANIQSIDRLFNTYYFSDRYSFGLQEFIESESFLHYLMHQTLITREQLNQRIHDIYHAHNQSIHKSIDQSFNFKLTPRDYLMGIMDLAGELMRFATNNTSTNPSFLEPLATFLRTLQSEFLTISLSSSQLKEFNQKMQVWRDCTEKIEKIQYRLNMRESINLHALSLIDRVDGSEFGSIREREEDEISGDNKRMRTDE